MAYIPEEGADERFAGQTFVITGTLPSMDRKEAAALIEKFGEKSQVLFPKRPPMYLPVKMPEAN